jgi:hypothetical protein
MADIRIPNNVTTIYSVAYSEGTIPAPMVAGAAAATSDSAIGAVALGPNGTLALTPVASTGSFTVTLTLNGANPRSHVVTIYEPVADTVDIDPAGVPTYAPKAA